MSYTIPQIPSTALSIATTDLFEISSSATSKQIAWSSVLGTAQTWTAIQTFSSALRGADGSSSAPAYSFTNETNTGWFLRSTGAFVSLSSQGTIKHELNPNGFITLAGLGYLWSTDISGSNADTGLTRISSGLVGVGTGAAASFAGSIKLTNITQASGGTLVLGNSATTGLTGGVLAAATNASIVISDQGGQAYRIPCII